MTFAACTSRAPASSIASLASVVKGYRRAAWFRGAAPLVVSGAFFKDSDPPEARPAVAVELTLSRHDEG